MYEKLSITKKLKLTILVQYELCKVCFGSQGSSVSSDQIIGLKIGVQFPAWQEIFIFSKTSRLSRGPTLPPTHWVQGVMQLGHEMTTNLHLVLRLSMYGATPTHAFVCMWTAVPFTLTKSVLAVMTYTSVLNYFI